MFSSTFSFNREKCHLTPTKIITYLGIEIDLTLRTLKLKESFVNKLQAEFKNVKNKIITLRYKQRLAGLINFARIPLKLPLQVVLTAYHSPFKLYCFSHIFHSQPVSVIKTLSQSTVYTDATETQIGLIDPLNNKLEVYKCNNNILENEYLGIWAAHIIRPDALIVTDNRAAMFLFVKGKLPPSWRQSIRLTILMIKT